MAAVISQAHGPWLLHLGHRERIVILESIAYLYSSLGYHRKEAYILREVVGCIMDLVVCAREENGSEQSSGATANGMEPDDPGAVAVKEIERSAGNESMINLIKYICEVHGINLEAVVFVNPAAQSSQEKDGVPQDANLDDLQEDPYGWPELQIGIIREALAVAEALPGTLIQCEPAHFRQLCRSIVCGTVFTFSSQITACCTRRRRSISHVLHVQ
jgi:hypothetical protein